ncbi:hypothetical protein CUMW_017290 [Citrus unshiu]|nr:hypothetical protein CUMW_017290 [Citrus unshiu]
MAATNGVEIDATGHAIGPRLESQNEDIVVRTQVDAMWEQMNKGVSSKTLMSFLNKLSPNVNKISSKMSNCWITYLGLAPKETGPSVVQNGIDDDDKKINALWEKMNEGVPKRKFKFFLSKPCSTVTRSSQTISNNWMKNLARNTESVGLDVPQENGILPQKRPIAMLDDTSDEAKRLAAAALSAVKAATAAAPSRGKIGYLNSWAKILTHTGVQDHLAIMDDVLMITEFRDFAGQDIEVKKFFDADSREASEKGKGPPTSAVDAVLEQIKKKPKLSVLDKTKKDWGEFKEEQRLEEELDAYKKSSNQYLDKVSFLQRADYREFERERDARLALQARRRSDMREEP